MGCQPWDELSMQNNKTLSQEFIVKYEQCLNFELLSNYYFFTTFMLKTFYKKLKFKPIIKSQAIEERFLIEYSQVFDVVEWELLSYYQDLSNSFSTQFKSRLNYEKSIKPTPALCYTKKSNQTFEKFSPLLFNEIDKNYKSCDIKCYEPKKGVNGSPDCEFHFIDLKDLKWRNFIRNKQMDENLLRKFSIYFDEVCWHILPKFYNLSKNFTEDFKDQLQYGNKSNKKLPRRCCDIGTNAHSTIHRLFMSDYVIFTLIILVPFIQF